MIHGRNILIYEGDVVIAAAKSCTINNNAEAVENSSPASGTARSYTVGRTGWEISISTLVLNMKDHLLQTGHSYTLTWKERDSDTDTMTGTAICTAAQVDAAVGNLAQGSFQFLGSDSNGTVVPEPTPTPSDYVTEQDVRNIINQYGFTTEQFVENYSGIAGGTITIGDASITPVSSVAMFSNALGLTVSGSPITSAGTFTLAYASGYEGFTTALKNKIEEIYSWFEVDANGDIKTKDTAGGHVRGFYTESFVSALGANSSGGGGGGGIELSDVWQSLKTNTDDYQNQKINLAHIPDLSGTYATKTWVNQQGFVTSSGVTSVAMTVPTGLSVSGTPITSTGTLALAFATGYSIPTTAKQSNWDTAYGWGNHATAGYASASSVTTLQGYFTDGVAKTAAKLNTGTTTYSAWGQTYWSSGVPQSISGNMTSVGSITPSANGNALGTTSARFAIYGTSGNFSGNVSISGTLGVTGATTLSSTLSVASGITLTTTKKIYFGDTSHYLELDSTGFHFSHGVYSDSFISALGANSSGGGGGGIDIEAMWAELQGNTGTYANAKINVNHIPDISSTYGYAKTSQLGNYLPLTGGTLYRSTSDAPLSIKTHNTSGAYIGYQLSDGTTMGFIGVHPTYGAVYVSSGSTYPILRSDNYSSYALPLSGGTMTGNVTFNGVNKGIYLTDSGGNTFAGINQNSENLWIGAQSTTATHHLGGTYISAGSDKLYVSKLVNGTRTNYIVLDAENYSSFALPLSGGTMTGNILFNTGDTTEKSVIFQTNRKTEDGGGWAYTPIAVRGADGSHFFHIGVFGSGDALSYAYLNLGGSYNSANSLRIYDGTSPYPAWGTNKLLHEGNYSSYALPLSGGQMTGPLTWKNGTALPNATTANYLLTIDDFASGGTTKWIGASSVTVGRATNADNADKLDGIDSRSIDSIYVGGWCAGTGTYYGKIAEYTSSTSGTVDCTATFLLTDYNTSGASSGNILVVRFRSSSPTTAPAINASWAVKNSDMDVYVRYQISNSRTYVRIYSRSSGWGRAINIKLLRSHSWSGSNITSWNLYSATNTTSGDVATYTSLPTAETAVTITHNNIIAGEVTATSDERLKTIVGDGNLDLRYIANAPNILFKWNNGQDDKVHGGSLAQYFLHGAKHFVLGSDKDYYSLNYGALATSMAISIAKEVVKHEDRITLLEKENARLKARVAELEERRA